MQPPRHEAEENANDDRWWRNWCCFEGIRLSPLGISAIGISIAVIMTVFGIGIHHFFIHHTVDQEPEIKLFDPDEITQHVRLPDEVRQVNHYTVYLLPFLEPDFSFEGNVSIDMTLDKNVYTVTLHSKDLVLDHKSIRIYKANSGKPVAVEDVRYDKKFDFVTIEVKEKLAAGSNVSLSLSFKGNLSDDLTGFYHSSHFGIEGIENWIALTQFQPTHARKAFPCFDEPHYKATFSIRLGRLRNMQSLSNMPKVTEKDVIGHSDYVWDIFNKSLPMSTYTVAFAVFDFDETTAEVEENQPKISIWTRRLMTQYAKYSAKIVPKIMSHFEYLFQSKFTLPKQDLVAAPDMKGVAMENWGLVISREETILYSEETTPLAGLQDVGVVMCHEVVHQWFGNLVSPKWWNGVWLNEGFATFFGAVCADYIQPHFNIFDQFIVQNIHPIMTLDASNTSHALSDLGGSTGIEMFDAITYLKASAIVRMMSKFLTKETFMKGIGNYLDKYKYSTATPDNLWQILEEQAHLDNTLPPNIRMKSVMDSWTEKMGYPLLIVSRNYQDNTVNLTQKRFLYDSRDTSSNNQWWVPVTYTTQEAPNFEDTETKVWLEPEKAMTVRNIGGGLGWVIFNIQECGFYKVTYDKRNWYLLSKQLNDNHYMIHMHNRAQIINDAFDLARTGEVEYKLVFNILGYLDKETEFAPWYATIDNLIYLRNQLRNGLVYRPLKTYCINLFKPLLQRLGYAEVNGDSHLNIKLRNRMMEILCDFEEEKCIKYSLELFSDWMKNPLKIDIPADIRETVFCTALRFGDIKHFDFLWNQFLSKNYIVHKAQILKSLGCTREVWLLHAYLDSLIAPKSPLRLQDGPLVLSSVVKNDVGRFVAWHFLRNHWELLSQKFGHGDIIAGEFLYIIGRDCNTATQLDELRTFLRRYSYKLKEISREVQNAIEYCMINIYWMEKNKDEFLKAVVAGVKS